MAGRRTDTRARIQRIALKLFAEQGYERTSMRQIAESVEVTKAALYYHFKTKDDILSGVLADFAAAVTELVAWGAEQPATADTRRELLRRYAELTLSGITSAARLLEENEPALQELPLAIEVRAQIVALFDLLTGPGVLDGTGGRPAATLRVKLAIAALHMAGDDAGQDGADPDLIREALAIANDLIAPLGP